TEADDGERLVVAPLDEDVAHHVGVFARLVFGDAAGRVGTDQLELVVVGALDPVRVDLVALGARLHVVPAVRVVDPAELHAEDRAGVRDLVGGHVNLVIAVASPAAIHLDALEEHGARIVVGAENSLARAVVDHAVTQRDVVGVMEEASRAAARQIQVLEDVVVARRLDGVDAAADARPRAAYSANDDGHRLGARIVEPDSALVVGATFDLHDVAGSRVGSSASWR